MSKSLASRDASIALATAQPETHTVPLDRITFDPSMQVRTIRDGGQTHLATVRSYRTAIRSGTALPPITLVRVEGVLYCGDGFHRSEAHRLECINEIAATIVEAPSLAEAAWIAARGNIGHGLRLSRREEAETFKRYVRAGHHRSGRRFKTYREMATDLRGIRGYTTLRNWTRKYFPSIFKAIGEDCMEFRKMADDGFKHQERLKAQVLAGLTNARNALGGITDPKTRGTLLAAAEAIVMEVRDGGPWTPSPISHEEDAPF